jgi:hypothetical protein
MSLKSISSKLESASAKFVEAEELFAKEAIAAIQKIASEIILSTPHITRYTQAMGTYFFSVDGTYICEDGEECPMEDLTDDMYPPHREVLGLSDEVSAKFDELVAFFEEHHKECLTGIPMKIQRRPDLLTETEVMTDW